MSKIEDEMEDIPTHLSLTHQMLKCAFPSGVDQEDYFPLLFVLQEYMSFRNVTRIMSLFKNIEEPYIFNDVLAVASQVPSIDTPDRSAIEKMKRRLLPCGYENWKHENWLPDDN